MTDIAFESSHAAASRMSRRRVRALSSLDDHLLRDIGLSNASFPRNRKWSGWSLLNW